MSEGPYDVAQICLNGHVINAYAKSEPNRNQKFCDECGASTMMQCEQCNTDINTFAIIRFSGRQTGDECSPE